MPLKIIVIVKAIHFFLCNTQNDPEKIKNHVEMLTKKRVDGLLVMCSEYTQHSLDVLSSFSSVPMVVMDWGPNTDTDIIEDNSFTGRLPCY